MIIYQVSNSSWFKITTLFGNILITLLGNIIFCCQGTCLTVRISCHSSCDSHLIQNNSLTKSPKNLIKNLFPDTGVTDSLLSFNIQWSVLEENVSGRSLNWMHFQFCRCFSGFWKWDKNAKITQPELSFLFRPHSWCTQYSTISDPLQKPYNKIEIYIRVAFYIFDSYFILLAC